MAKVNKEVKSGGGKLLCTLKYLVQLHDGELSSIRVQPGDGKRTECMSQGRKHEDYFQTKKAVEKCDVSITQDQSRKLSEHRHHVSLRKALAWSYQVEDCSGRWLCLWGCCLSELQSNSN